MTQVLSAVAPPYAGRPGRTYMLRKVARWSAVPVNSALQACYAASVSANSRKDEKDDDQDEH